MFTGGGLPENFNIYTRFGGTIKRRPRVPSVTLVYVNPCVETPVPLFDSHDNAVLLEELFQFKNTWSDLRWYRVQPENFLALPERETIS